MAQGYDGIIRINTKIDEKGINTGTKIISNSLFKAFIGFLKFGYGIRKVFDGVLNVVKNIGKALLAVTVGGAIALKGLLGQFDFFSSSLADKFKPLKDSFDVLKGTLINLIATAFVPLIPYVVTAVQWLTRMLQIVTQIVAAFFGFETTVGSIMSNTAKGADKSAKAAKGALAAFDQINVLEIKKDPETEAPEDQFITPAAITVLDDILEKVENIKKIWAALWEDPIGLLRAIWEVFVNWFKEHVISAIAEWWKNSWLGKLLAELWQNFKDTWQRIKDNASERFEAIKENIFLIFKGIKQFVIGVFTGDWALAWEGLKNIVSGVFGAIWEFIKGWVISNLLTFGGFKKSLLLIWEALPQPIKDIFINILNWLKEKWSLIGNWFSDHVGEPIKNVFAGVRSFVLGIFNDILGGINNLTNSIIDNVNRILDSLQSITGFNMPNIPNYDFSNTPISTYGTVGGGYKPPHLATGAVIPPNQKFAAILGDQTSGRNLEAPESLIRQLLREELGTIKVESTVNFTGTMSEFVRQFKPEIDKENIRVGKSLIKK